PKMFFHVRSPASVKSGRVSSQGTVARTLFVAVPLPEPLFPLLPGPPVPLPPTTIAPEPRLLSALFKPDRSGPCEPDLTPSPWACACESRKDPLSGLPPNVGLTG